MFLHLHMFHGLVIPLAIHALLEHLLIFCLLRLLPLRWPWGVAQGIDATPEGGARTPGPPGGGRARGPSLGAGPGPGPEARAGPRGDPARAGARGPRIRRPDFCSGFPGVDAESPVLPPVWAPTELGQNRPSGGTPGFAPGVGPDGTRAKPALGGYPRFCPRCGPRRN